MNGNHIHRMQGLCALAPTYFCLRRSRAASLNTGCWQSIAQEVSIRSRQELGEGGGRGEEKGGEVRWEGEEEVRKWRRGH